MREQAPLVSCGGALPMVSHPDARSEGWPRALEPLVMAAPPRAGKTRVVAIDGRSGAGKSTFAGALAARLVAPVVSLETLYPGWGGLEKGISILVSEVLVPLAANRTVALPRYDWIQGHWQERRTALVPPPILIVEGVGCGAGVAAQYTSLLVWLELSAPTRRARALARDGDLYRDHWERWAAQEDALMARELTWARADAVIHGASADSPHTWRGPSRSSAWSPSPPTYDGRAH